MHTNNVSIDRHQLVHWSRSFNPDAAVFMVLLALKANRGISTTLACLSSETDYNSDVLASILEELERRELLAIAPRPYGKDVDRSLQILVLQKPMLPEKNAVPYNVTLRNGDCKYTKDVNVTSNRTPEREIHDQPLGDQLLQSEDANRWAFMAARMLDDNKNLGCYRAYATRYPRELLDQALHTASNYPAHKVRKSRGALFVHIIGFLAGDRKRPNTHLPGDKGETLS